MKVWLGLFIILGCGLFLAGCGAESVGKADNQRSAYNIITAEYPEMPQYPDEMDYVDKKTGEINREKYSEAYTEWWQSIRYQKLQSQGYTEGIDAFFAKSMPEFLSGADNSNRVYSPLNVYMALAMLAELTDGESRSQILDLLETEDIGTLRKQANEIWNANYRDDGAEVSVLAGSLWLNQDVTYVQKTMETLAKNYYASVFQGEMGSAEYNKELQNWLNEQTGGLLEEQVGDIAFNKETIMALATTVYFRSKWADEFSESETKEQIFHANGKNITCDFMHRSDSGCYYWGDKFSAVEHDFEGNGSMWFVLPDEGISVEELLTDAQTMDFIMKDSEWENNKFMTINLSVPKFDVVSDISLVNGLKKLGITDVFDMKASDFSPMIKGVEDICLSQVQHAARVAIDEEGCVAAAYTVMIALGAAMPPDEEIDFVLDRPFLFVITGTDGVPMFVGIVNQP